MEQKTIAKVPIKTDHVELIQKTPDQAFCESRTKEVDLKSLNQAIQDLDLGMDFLQKVDAAYEKVESLLYQIKQLAAPGLESNLDFSGRSALDTKISFRPLSANFLAYKKFILSPSLITIFFDFASTTSSEKFFAL